MIMKPETKKKELNVPANLFRGIEAVGGRMKITETEIVFHPHKINVNRNDLTLKMSDIKEVGKRNTLYIVPNGLRIVVISGEEYKFVVNNRNKLIKRISEQISK
ncbi:GRAM domain-containing protein [Paenisporosarcina indica]|uniref:GRAM domain-containing protein n=1 Tax=Paenisporosarcina indica TaxID=650093 RepID=UPI00094FB74B|nr:GRAM domain-containing protein [Paenisporosarcina indica]